MTDTQKRKLSDITRSAILSDAARENTALLKRRQQVILHTKTENSARAYEEELSHKFGEDASDYANFVLGELSPYKRIKACHDNGFLKVNYRPA
jgi:hypothetical protein